VARVRVASLRDSFVNTVSSPTVAGIEVQMTLIRFTEVRLLEDERHAERTLPEVQSGLTCRPHERNVM
jgi:hypothetical protein